jgi:hypothetical protein
MQFPEDDQLDIAKFTSVFADTSNSYKFYWLLAILDGLSKGNRISMRWLCLHMVAEVWYPLDYFKLSFGKKDGFLPIANFVSQHLAIDNRPTAPNLLLQLEQTLSPIILAQFYKRVDVLLHMVPYRFIRPFFAAETRGLPDQNVNARVAALANTSSHAPYRFAGDAIEVHPAWADYLRRHRGILRGFTYWHLVRFLQKHNPNVIGLSEKLTKPVARVLTTAGRFWKEYVTATPDLTCIYSGQQLKLTDLSLDHFLPWSYMAHDLLWNIIPTPKAVNSAKNNWLPSIDLYFDSYARLQFTGFHFHAELGHEKLLEDYHVLFAQSLSTLKEQSFEWFRERLAQQVIPQLQTAKNLGFAYPFEYLRPPL